MVMQERRRYLTVDEARRAGPPTAEQIERTRRVIANSDARHEAARADGRHLLSAEEILWALGRSAADDDECDDPFPSDPAE